MSRRPDEMLPPACVPFAQRLIDSPERAIADPDVRAHVADCPECRDLAAALEAAAALLAQAQREGAGPSRGHLQSLAKRAATPTAVPAERRRNLFPTPLRWGFAGAAVVSWRSRSHSTGRKSRRRRRTWEGRREACWWMVSHSRRVRRR